MPAEVLVVDDSPVIRSFLASLLPRFGFEVRLAAGGREAIEVYREHRGSIALVLMDVQMPGLDGPEALAALRALDPAVRCCLMSADAGLYTPEQLHALGAMALLAKPFGNPAGLARTLWECVGQQREGLARSS
jgi:CheY-like chemotaxis protein